MEREEVECPVAFVSHNVDPNQNPVFHRLHLFLSVWMTWAIQHRRVCIILLETTPTIDPLCSRQEAKERLLCLNARLLVVVCCFFFSPCSLHGHLFSCCHLTHSACSVNNITLPSLCPVAMLSIIPRVMSACLE